ncbi:MAG TPA: (2Fe-2S) ferredoxin domain-containing protein [bacterium]|nr:(2Fe-2S) ferredoxin domain-containing protein [bacterium]
MPKLSIEDLKKFREQARKADSDRRKKSRAIITVHMGTCGIASGAGKILDSLKELLTNCAIDDIVLTSSGCAGLCSKEPMITVELPDMAPVKYVNLTKDKINKIFNDHVINGKIVPEFAFAIGNETIF